MIDIHKLRDICQRDFASFVEFGKHHNTPSHRGYFVRNCGHEVLAVAHLDTVLPGNRFSWDGERVWCPALDDRLGVYVLLDLLPKLGVKFDLLLTDAEEVGDSTAQFFQPPRRYNWMFSFDRAGSDVVLYQYDTPALRGVHEAEGFNVGVGTYSDIAYLEYLGCCGMNVGVGYHRQHRHDCFASLDQTEAMVRRFAAFWHRNGGTHLPHPDEHLGRLSDRKIAAGG